MKYDNYTHGYGAFEIDLNDPIETANNEENRYLAELKDALLLDLMTGKLIIPGGDEDGK